MMLDGIALVLTNLNVHGRVPSAKKCFPVPSKTG